MAARKYLIDVSPLQESDQYRLLWGGEVVSFLGTQLSVVAVPVQAYDLTHSSVVVGLLGLAQLGPLLACSLLGGTIADAFDRRRILLTTQVLLAACTAGLALNAMVGHRVWPLFVLSGAIAGLSGIDRPTRAASVARLVTPERFAAAAALEQTLMQVGLVVGPAVGGLLIAKVSLSAAYWTDVATFGVATATVFAMRGLPPEGGGTRVGFASVGEGLRYLKGRKALQGTFVIDINAMVFGMPRAIFPELAARTFHGGAGAVGLLYAAPGLGALLGALSSGWVTHVRRQGRAVLWAVVLWGVAVAAFGLSPWLWLALVLLAVAGAADVISAVFRNTILQLSVPDRLRGRLSAVHIGVVAGGPRLGDTEAGVVAGLTSPRISAVSGGLVCLAGVGVIARLMPELGRWTRASLADDPELAHAAAGEGA